MKFLIIIPHLHVSIDRFNGILQMVSVLIGVIYYGQELNQDGVMNINGALFIFLTNMTFQNVFAVINVSTEITYFSLGCILRMKNIICLSQNFEMSLNYTHICK
jgi:hypothetical protein